MGFMDSFFGGGESTQTTTPWGSQIPYLEEIFKDAQQQYQSSSGSGAQQAYQDFLGQAGQQASNMLGAYGQAYQMAMNPASQVTAGDIQALYDTDLVQSQIDAATAGITRDLQENQLTATNAAAGATGNVGSSRKAVMDAVAIRGANDLAASTAADIQGSAYNQAVNMAMANSAQQNQQQQFASQMLGSLGQQAYQMGTGAYQGAVDAPWRNMQNYLNMVGGNFGSSTTSSGGGNMAGGLGSLLAGAGTMWAASDPRLKKNIRKVEEKNGVNFYEWEWNDEAKEHFGLEGKEKGVISTEHPDAVIPHDSGYDMVDYAVIAAKVGSHG